MNRTSAIACIAAVLVCSCAASSIHHGKPPTPAFNTAVTPADDCWARLYENKDFTGRALTIAGPQRVTSLPPHWGFPWEPRYESLTVGKKASIGLFDDPNLHERLATFGAGATIRDLDRELSVFRRVRSAQVSCKD